jgi:hypothetical protein
MQVILSKISDPRNLQVWRVGFKGWERAGDVPELAEFIHAPQEETFFIEEYKSLRQELTTKLKDRLEFNRWGLIGLAALYSYIFSNPGKPILFWVPVLLSVAVIAHLNEEHRMVDKTAAYIREKVEPWGLGGATLPGGWEIFLKSGLPTLSWWQFWKRWPLHLWGWSPVPMWIVLFFVTLVMAIGVSNNCWPSLTAPSVTATSPAPTR